MAVHDQGKIMNNVKTGAIVGFVALLAITVMAFINDGTQGFPSAIFFNLTSLQIWVDLVIAIVFWCAWLVQDAKSHGRNPWPWIVAALIVGCFAPLLYAIVYSRWMASPVNISAPAQTGMRRGLGIAVLGLFTVLTVAALMTDGTDVPAVVTRSWSNFQIWFDLVIAIVFWLGWMIQDARAQGRSPWGWVVFALVLGSFAPLVYLVAYGRWPASHPTVA